MGKLLQTSGRVSTVGSIKLELQKLNATTNRRASAHGAINVNDSASSPSPKVTPSQNVGSNLYD